MRVGATAALPGEFIVEFVAGNAAVWTQERAVRRSSRLRVAQDGRTRVSFERDRSEGDAPAAEAKHDAR